MTQEANVFYSTTRWQDPEGVGNYFIFPTTTITNTDQKSEERVCQVGKDLLETYHNMRTALRQIFEIAIDPEYHSGVITNTGMARQVFDNNKTTTILERLKILYGTPSLQELNQALIRLQNSMDCNQPLEVMLRTT